MAQVVVRNLEDRVVERLRRRASERRQSLEQTLREILTEAARPSRGEVAAEMARIRAMTPKPIKTDSAVLIRRDRDRR